MSDAVRRTWWVFWATALTGLALAAWSLCMALVRSPLYLVGTVTDLAAVGLLVWSIIQLRRAFEAQRAEAVERETVVRRYVATQGSDRHHL